MQSTVMGLDVCCLGCYDFFCCLHLHGITKFVVVKVDVGKKDQKRVFFKDRFYGFHAWCLVGFLVLLAFFFNERSYIFK